MAAPLALRIESGASLNAAGWPDPVQWLSPGERRRWQSFSSPARQQLFLAGRWLLRGLLAQHRGGAPEEQSLEIDAEGRSHVAAAPACHVSLSHAGDWLVAALAGGPIGVDIERLRPRRDLLGVARFVMSEAELAGLAALEGDAQLLRFYQGWTLKEAWLKRQGSGLDFARMRSLDFQPCAPDQAQALSLRHREHGLLLAVVGAGLSGITCPPGFEFVAWLRD